MNGEKISKFRPGEYLYFFNAHPRRAWLGKEDGR